MKSIWKGHVRFSLVTVPIRLYSAVDSEEKLSFKQLHKEDHGAVGYEKKCKKCGKILTSDEIIKGFEFEPEKFVIVSDEDFQKIQIESTKVIELQGFIDAKEIHPTLYESPYLVGPDGPVAGRTYSLLSEALKTSGKVGIGKVILREREETVMLSPQEGGLVLYKLRQPGEVRKMADVPQIEKRDVNKEELKLSVTLVESMASTFDEIDLTDRYRGALRNLIEAKIAGREVVATPEVQLPALDIVTALMQSLEQAKAKKKPMERAKGATKASPVAVASAEVKTSKQKRSKAA